MNLQQSNSLFKKYTNYIPILSFLGLFILSFDIIIICVTYSSIIYSGNLSSFYSIGLHLLIVGSIVTLVITSLFSSLPSAIAHPQDAPFPLIMIMSASIATMLSAQGHGEAMFLTIVCSITIATLMTGIFLFLLGVFKLGRLVSFIPYPALGGFFAGLACLLLTSSLTMLTELHIQFDILPKLFKLVFLLKWLPAFFFAVVFFILFEVKKNKAFLLTPVILGVLMLFYGVAYFLEISIAELQEQGFLVKSKVDSNFFAPLKKISLRSIDWRVVLSQAGNIVTIVFFSSISLLVNAVSLQISLNKEIDFNRELKVAGISNLLTGMVGGFVGYLAVGSTILNARMQTDPSNESRWVGLCCALLCFFFLLYGLFLVSYIPLFIPGGLLMFMAFLFIKKWVVDVRYTMQFLDYCIILIILLIVVKYNAIYGLFAGIICSLFLFIFNYGKLKVIQSVLTGKQIHSRKQREPIIEKGLLEQGKQLIYIKLQNYLFFGNANYLVEDLEKRLSTASTPIRYVIYDYSSLAGLDSSFILNLKRMKQIADNKNVILIFAGTGNRIGYLAEKIEDNAMLSIHIFPNYDEALEWCEDQIIRENNLELKKSALLEHPLVGSQKDMEHYFKRISLKKGDVLFQQGDPPGPMYYIESGHLHVFLVTAHKKTIRLRTIGPGNTVGEVAFYLGQTRNATIAAADDCILQEFSEKSILHLQNENPKSAIKFHRFIIRILAERVEFENESKIVDVSTESVENGEE